MFTKAEKMPIYDHKSYRLLADYANYCEFVSLKSGHYWRIRVEDGKIITYHKYGQDDKYHVQCGSASIASAERKIRQHDDYVRKYARQKIMWRNI